MAKPELGTKRLCGACGAKFYDLNKDPILCPKCSTVFEVVALPVRARAEPAAVKPVAKAATVMVAPETADAEFVSLEDADIEASGGKSQVVDGDDEVEADDSEEMDAFIEEAEDGDPDVTDIIGDGIEKEEET